jgi:hypothetical protein
MLSDNHTISEICEELRKRIYMMEGTEEVPFEQIQRDTCHALKIAFSAKAKEMTESVEEWQTELEAKA